MRLHTGITFDATGYPVGAVSRDEGPSRARPSAHNGTPSYRGRLVVGRSELDEHREAQRAYKRRLREQAA